MHFVSNQNGDSYLQDPVAAADRVNRELPSNRLPNYKRNAARTLSSREEPNFAAADRGAAAAEQAASHGELAFPHNKQQPTFDSYIYQMRPANTAQSSSAKEFTGARLQKAVGIMKNAIKRKPRDADFSAYENNNLKGRSMRNHSSLGKSASGHGPIVKTRRNIMQVNWSSDRNNDRCHSEMQAFG